MMKLIIAVCLAQVIGACIWVWIMKTRDKKLKEFYYNQDK